MARVTYDKLFSEARTNVVALVTSGVSDPIASSAQSRKWIYSRLPDTKSSEFSGYPLIVVKPADTDVDEQGTTDGKSKPVFWAIEVEVITSDRGYGSADGQGLSQIDAISDDVIQTFLSKTNRTSLSNNSMKFSRPTTTAVIEDVIKNELVYRRSILLSFNTRIQVSA